jgi:hypothetical protein
MFSWFAAPDVDDVLVPENDGELVTVTPFATPACTVAV